MADEQPGKDIFVCSRLREERKRIGLDQNQLAELAGVNLKTVGRWEKATAIPSDKLSGLAAYGIDVFYVLSGLRELGAEPVTDDERTVLSCLRTLSDADRMAVIRLTKALAETSHGG